MLYAKMLKETENEETRLFFCQICVIGGISIEGGPGPLGLPMASPMILRYRALKFFNKKKKFKAKLK